MRQALLHWRRREIPLHMRIMAAMLAVCLLLVGLDGWRTWQARVDVIAADKAETANLARSLSQHAHDTLYVVDVILTGLRERIEMHGLGPELTDRLQRAIAMRLEGTPELCGLAVLDAAGGLVAGRQNATGAGTDNADFAYHRTQADRGIHVGDATRSCDDGQWGLAVSRRIDDGHGRFAGIVQARISIGLLQRFYGSFAIGSHGLISLASLQGSIVARTDGTQARIGASVSSGPIFHMIRAGRTTGSFRYVSIFDGIVRLGSFRTVDDYPLFILVGHALDEVLAGWRVTAWLHMAISLLASALLLLTGSRVAGHVRIRQQAERRYRLLAENSSDAIVCIGLDGNRRYVSPAFTVLTGWSAEEVVARNASDIIHPEDVAYVATQLPQLLAGAPQMTSCFRYICKDGSPLWVETRARLLQADGEMQVISNVRDITDRRRAEDHVAALNRELAEQANTDGLTGVANRRRLDEALAHEWRRARHEEAPLSLLMIDVDRFKPFNDRYGHQRGDECLRAVAAAVMQVAQGPDALTARYGGEEFVVLLPRTDAVAAAALAGRVLAAVRAMAIAHEDGGSAGTVTVSIGVATATPWVAGTEARDAATLIADADAALYEAKHAGRDRTVTHDPVLPVDLPCGPPCGLPSGLRQGQALLADHLRAALPAAVEVGP